ncbi:SoxR reducing system RseC family protein [Fusobacterium sp.]|uniref:SoxR reducing system RseC family protein n=1 Tax=Fusobacterium sp. TaxID=68766 RepID=UPI00262AC676|nr:SoxR reducing system RseC family protein [Fusobacterium sp.]
MESSGKVTKIEGKKLVVKMFKESSCAHCSGCGDASKLTREIELEYNPKKQEIEVGDIVTFELADSKMLKIGFLVYVLPIIMMVAGFSISNMMGRTEGESVLVSFATLVVTFLLIHLYDRFVVKEKVNMDITRIEKDNGEFDIDSCKTK